MTRKRYIKLIMAMGLSRNQARELAAVALADGMTYQDAYDRAVGLALFRLWQKTIKELMKDAALVAGADGGLHFVEPQKCPADGFRNDFVFVDELAGWPPEEGMACR